MQEIIYGVDLVTTRGQRNRQVLDVIDAPVVLDVLEDNIGAEFHVG